MFLFRFKVATIQSHLLGLVCLPLWFSIIPASTMRPPALSSRFCSVVGEKEWSLHVFWWPSPGSSNCKILSHFLHLCVRIKTILYIITTPTSHLILFIFEYRAYFSFHSFFEFNCIFEYGKQLYGSKVKTLCAQKGVVRGIDPFPPSRSSPYPLTPPCGKSTSCPLPLFLFVKLSV